MKTMLIAEAGSTHGNDLDVALKLVDDCADAGVTAVKFQFWSDAARLAQRRNAPHLEAKYREFQLPADWLLPLKQRCVDRGLKFGCTAYLPEDLPMLAPLVDFWKIASFEALDQDFLLAHYAYPKAMIVSTGMCDERELLELRDVWRTRRPCSMLLLHCVSGYPSPLDQVNLAVINRYGLDGFSDHTGCVLTGGFAVIAGAQVVEVHVRPGACARTNPDFPHSLTIDGLRSYIQGIRAAEAMLGVSPKRVQESERENRKHRAGV